MLDSRHFLLLLACCPNTAAQVGPPGSPEALLWAIGQGTRFEQYINPVVSAHALATLAALVCEHDASTGAGLFRKALARLDNIPDAIFVDAQSPVLPISSFTGLWRMVTASALKCDATLTSLVDTERIQLRLALERQQANNTVFPKAFTRIAADPERAAQLAELVFTAGEIENLSFGDLGLFLAQLRERAPEVGDRVFATVCDAVASVPVPSTAALNDLGRYLFVDPQKREFPDEFNLSRDLMLQSSLITDFRTVRYSTNSEPVEAYIRATLRILEKASSANYNPTLAYSVAYQTLAHANAMGLDTKDLTEALPKIATGAGPQVQSAIGPSGTDAGSIAAERSRAVAQVLTAARGKRFAEARQLLPRVDDELPRGQAAVLIDFAEAASAIANGDLLQAARLANGVRPGGFKRVLLYTGLVAAGDPQQISLATRDAALLPAEFRAAGLIALADALIQTDPERFFSILPNIVEALNAARTAPRQGRFDPVRRRSAALQGAAAGTDIPFIPLSTSRFYEVIDTNGSRHPFELAVPRVGEFTLPGLLRRAGSLDLRRLEAAALGLRGEMQQAAALLAIVESRVKGQAVR